VVRIVGDTNFGPPEMSWHALFLQHEKLREQCYQLLLSPWADGLRPRLLGMFTLNPELHRLFCNEFPAIAGLTGHEWTNLMEEQKT
jgi:hypothetical protein